MVISLEDILSLPKLENGKVISGGNYLWRKITSVRVVYPVTDNWLEKESTGFSGNILAVTNFDEIWEAPQMQRQFVEYLANSGVVALIILSNIQGRNTIRKDIIDAANELLLPIIFIPGKNDVMLIGEVVENISNLLLSTEERNSLSIAMLEYVLRQPIKSRNLEAAVKMLSDYFSVSIIIMNSLREVVVEHEYPSGQHLQVFSQSKQVLGSMGEEPVFTKGVYIADEEIRDSDGRLFYLYVISSSRIDRRTIITLKEMVSFAIRLWETNTKKIALTELIDALIQNEPLKINRLASLFRVNVFSLDGLWIIHCENNAESSIMPKLEAVKEILPASALVDIYDGDIVAFLESPRSIEAYDAMKNSLVNLFDDGDVMVCFNSLPNPKEFRVVYSVYTRYFDDARKIYPRAKVMDESHLNMVTFCRKGAVGRAENMDSILYPMYRAEGKSNQEEMKKFLATFIFDAGMDVNKTAEILFLHRNTVKYRLKSLSDSFGYNIGDFPNTYLLMIALGGERLK